MGLGKKMAATRVHPVIIADEIMPTSSYMLMFSMQLQNASIEIYFHLFSAIFALLHMLHSIV